MTEEKKKQYILLNPCETLKSTLVANYNCYVFVVNPKANKYQIAQAFEEMYGEKVIRVNTTAIRSKQKRTRFGISQRMDGKKAYIYTKAPVVIEKKMQVEAQ